MNYSRLVLAAVAATVADAVYGFLVYGMLLTSEFARYPAIFRPTDVQTAFLPTMFAGIFVAMLAATYIYAKGYEGRGGAGEGLRFGAVVGVFVVGYVAVVNYAVLYIGRKLAASMACAGFVEWLVVGLVIGLAYGAGGAASRKAVGV